MRKRLLILSTIIAFCMLTIESSAQESDVNLYDSPPIGGAMPPSRMPGKKLLSLTVTFDDSNNELTFHDENQDNVIYYIYNEDNVCMAQGVCNFNKEGNYSVLLDLDDGIYTLNVILNNEEYYGRFCIRE